ncbi:MAG: helix-turn-helix transcriptional regulator [Bacillota bacterium]
MCDRNKDCQPGVCSCRGGKIERFIEPCLLLLLKKNQPAHGYELLDSLQVFGVSGDPGSLYRTLRRLENEGMVTSDWDTSGTGPAKRMYRLLPAGEKLLEHWINHFKAVKQTLDMYIKTYEQVKE